LGEIVRGWAYGMAKLRFGRRRRLIVECRILYQYEVMMYC
jgi:FKBP-type peptidyl-prolyl cis-trans isomerase